MPGSPVKHEKRRLVEAATALLCEDRGVAPERLFVKSLAALLDKSEAGEVPAFIALRDSIDGPPTQRIQQEGGTGKLVDAALLGGVRALLERVPERRERVIEPEKEMIDGPGQDAR